MASKNFKVSATRLSTFLSCHQKYYFNYIKKIPKISNPAFKLGTAVHETLEFAGHIWIEEGKFTKASKDKIMAKYTEISIREGIEEYDIHLLGKDLVKKRLGKFVEGEKVIGLETKFGFWGQDSGPQIKSKYGVPLMGAIDKVEMFSEDTILIVDYKTSNTQPTPSQLKVDNQLSIYDIVARQIWPGYSNVVLSLDLLKFDPVFTYRTDKQREEFECYLKEVYDQMLAFDEENVKPTLNMFCPWCDYKDYCNEYKKACDKSDYEFLPVMHYTNDRLVEEWTRLKDTKKILEERVKTLDMVMMEKIRRESENLKGEGQEVYVRQNSRVTYDLDTVHNAVPAEDFPHLVNVNKKAVDAYLNLNPAIRNDIERASTVNYTSPFLATRKINETSKKKSKK